ncbi:Flagellar motor switch protein FliN [Sulfitobacter donghicola DSW-25 = KCTC 12864 = JCM 14565]|nr:Flagellar motor switch protein FliN [Sulfitobacter donghicola DSW-25 = KCTC 12864 = JCM 14565]
MTLDRRVDDLVELFVSDKLIARGVLEEAEGDASGQLLVRLTEVVEMQQSS